MSLPLPLPDASDSVWPMINGWFARSPRAVEVLPPVPALAAQVKKALEVTASGSTALGAVAEQTGGILVDQGWLRILGSGCDRMAGNLANWNGLGPDPKYALEGALIVAHDALGGLFALDGGALGKGDGEAHYFSPDTLSWEGMGFDYPGLIEFLLTGDLDGFYGSVRWAEWKRELGSLSPDSGLHTYPPLWSKEGKDPARVSRKAVPMTQLVSVALEYARQQDGGA